jgi:8-oxo-dGTP pyrophosphatase MutT (NUDIX family)
MRLARRLASPAVAFVDFVVDGHRVGAITAARAGRLAAFDDVFRRERDRLVLVPRLDTPASRDDALARVARALADEGALSAWRDERYDVAPPGGGPLLFRLERAAARHFGIATRAVHVNGLVRSTHGTAMWLARRSASKAIDPGRLDNLVGGGIASGMGIADTLVKEADEEAGIDAALASCATPARDLRVHRLEPDGLQDEILHAHDLWLPDGFRPLNRDGEVAGYRLVPLGELPALLAQDDGPDALTVDASLVALDALLRLGTIAADDPLRPALERLGALR